MLILAMKKQRAFSVLQRSVHFRVRMAVVVGLVILTGIVLTVAIAGYKSSSKQSVVLSSPQTPTVTPTPSLSPTLPLTSTLSPTQVPHPAFDIPPADWLNMAFQYYDSNLDITVNVPPGWSIVNDPSAAGLAMPGAKPQPIGTCFPDLREFFKDFSQCPTTLGYALKISSNAATQIPSYLVLMGVSNGFGGSCNQAITNGNMALYDAYITINNHPYILTTGRTMKSFAGHTSAGTHLDCFYWPRIFETGSKSVWAMFTVRHSAADDASFITEMQILENIQVH